MAARHPYPQALRVRRRAEYSRIQREGVRVQSSEFTVFAATAAGTTPRLGLAVGRRVGNAVVRNRIRRMLKEAFRLLAPELVPVDLVIVARPEAAPFADLRLKDLEARVLPLVQRAIERLLRQRRGG